MQRNDILWKAILEDVFDDFLRFFFENADKIFDMKRGFEFLDKELEQLFPSDTDISNPKYVDKLVKVYTKNGKEKWILVHIEVQGYTDKNFAKRMFTYYYRILDKYDKPITAFAILTDSNAKYHPKSYESSYLGTNLIYEFNTYKIYSQSDSELDKSENPFASVVETVRAALQKRNLTEDKLFDLKVELAKKLLSKKFTKEKIRGLMNFLQYYIRFENTENYHKFEEVIDSLNENDKVMGIEQFLLQQARKEGVEQGVEKGISIKEIEFVKSLIENTDFNDEKIALLANTNIELVKKTRESLK